MLLLFGQPIFAQDSALLINNQWTVLKTQIRKRAALAINLSDILVKSSKINKEELMLSKNNSKDLINYLDTLNSKDSISIAMTFEKNENLTRALTRTLSNLDNNDKYYSNKEFSNILLQLEAMENRIVLEKMEYNDICKEYKRFDLLFGTDKVEKGPKVEFYDKANTQQKVWQ